MKRAGTFGARPCRAIRARLFAVGAEALPKGWRRSWIIARIRATPPWADFRAIKAIYKEAQRLSELTGIKHHVDHDIPLQHPLVSGLHVHANLRICSAASNLAKNNRWPDPNQLDLDFGETP